MAINVTNIGIGVAVGVLDDQMEKWDTRKLRTGAFKTARDISRAAVVVLGYGAGMFMPRYSGLGAVAAQSALPLLTKSVIQAVSGATAARPGGVSSNSFVSRKVGRTYEPEAKNVGII